MDTISYVPSSLKEVVGLLLEKELRLRFPVEELDLLLEPETEEDYEDHSVNPVDDINENRQLTSDEEDGNIFSDDFESTSDVEMT